ncbi:MULTISPECIES: NAD(P)H-binding protein [unclassified Streptomyces]|uniref:NAD(P)-dependent oxidoreductase n=1 Tax=unclassified Streptomyces TaxID=2593676 RepID=UPI0036E82F06
MTIAVFGAGGMVGSRVVGEAVTRGHGVLALSRKPGGGEGVLALREPGGGEGALAVSEAPGRGHGVLAVSPAPGSGGPAVTPVAVDAGDASAVREVLAGRGVGVGSGVDAGRRVDAVVLAVRSFPVDEGFLVGATRVVLDAAAEAGTRVLVVGGAGALRSPGGSGLLVADDPAYVPAEWRPVAAAGVAQLRTCRSHPTADWVYLSPPALLEPGERTGRYRRGTDTLLTAPDGRSWISAEDLAVAVIDELESPGAQPHITVVHDQP